MEEAVRTIDCLHLQWDQLALCPSMAAQGHSPCATPQGGARGLSYLREGWRQPHVGRSANLRSTNSLSLAPKLSTL